MPDIAKKRADVSGRSQQPPMEVTEEAKARHLDLARAQGDALQRALHEMTQNVADGGGEAHVGELLVSYAFEEAEGMWMPEDGELRWHEPEEENIHIEIGVRDAGDGRFVPGLDVQVDVIEPDGTVLGSHKHPFLWHPWLYHYGRNWKVPGDGRYRLAVHIKPAAFMRHDQKNGARFADSIDVQWSDVLIETGQKRSS